VPTAAEKAITLRPDLADGYIVRGYIRSWGEWDFQGAGCSSYLEEAHSTNRPTAKLTIALFCKLLEA
jgi:hypothetical protein